MPTVLHLLIRNKYSFIELIGYNKNEYRGNSSTIKLIK